ncbi:MutS family DNA mismatch repair protein [Ferruginibacter sp.]|uniref:MutS family DNA mismatch repair protein n=1 Tax=Ferruginibacter sp. TaxID=1940288 RepID=UPI00265B1A5C|nr:MutS family DNA mismatch repair protein [Ferruginibacter sp.]
MLPQNFYENKITDLQKQLQQLLQKKSLFGWLRFAVVVVLVAAIYILLPSGLLYVAAAAIILMIFFTRLLLIDLRNKANIEKTRYLININKDELKALAHDYYHFEDGLAHSPKEHLYSNDLDIFGRASLFQYINRTASEMGSALLADWLLHPADTAILQQRQTAIKELAIETEWRQQLQALGKQKKIQTATQQRLQNWLNEPKGFSSAKYWAWLRFVLPGILLTILALNIAGIVPYQIRNMALLVFAIIAYFIAKKVAPIHQYLSKIVSELEVMAGSIELIEKLHCTTELLTGMQEQFLQKNYASSSALKELKGIVEKLDLRFSPVVFIPLDVLLQWDLQQVLALDKWKKKYHQHALQWFNMLAQFEALSSLATLSFNHTEWYFPVFKESHFFMQGKQIGHPLINVSKRVNNDILINESGEIMLITGSNMAGKSTYLRSIGINVVLAMAGAPVCAESFTLSPVKIISSMRISDNLEESTSTFYAELKKLKTVIDLVNEGAKVFILLDEILRGTNSLDRHTGSVALLKQLIKKHAAGIIATHDVELAQLKETFPHNILNYHFDAQVSNDELYFDYKLKTGVCESLNASILMKKIGIEL